MTRKTFQMKLRQEKLDRTQFGRACLVRSNKNTKTCQELQMFKNKYYLNVWQSIL